MKESDPLLGRVINDRFRVDSLIARGGMGRVYKAEQQPLGRVIALKVLDPRYKGDEDPEFQERFFLEASIAAKLTHPNTVTVFDYGKTDDEIYFIAMEYVEGLTLAEHMKQDGAMDPGRCINICVQIARSLREAHGLSVIHRDLKPANVLITKHGDQNDFVKVLDFGLVKDIEAEGEDLTQQGLFMGSPKYMSPEQIRGGAIDGRTDIYSLGVLLYKMLTTRVPFDRNNQVQTLMAHCKDPVPLLSDETILVPEPIEEVVMKCLAKEPEDRYATMNDVIIALKTAGGLMGAGVAASGSYPADMSNSGMRAVAEGLTPSGPIPIVTATPSGGYALQEPKKGGAGKMAVVLLLLAGLAGGAFALTRPDVAEIAEATPEVAPEPVPEVVPEAIPEVAPEPIPEVVPEPTPEVIMAHVLVTVTSSPSGAAVVVDGEVFGTTPTSVEWVGEQAAVGREVSFVFSRRGYRDVTVTRMVVEGEEEIAVNAELSIYRRPTTSMSSSMMATTMDEGAAVRDPSYLDNPY